MHAHIKTSLLSALQLSVRALDRSNDNHVDLFISDAERPQDSSLIV
jgi:hypothetical protein